MGNYTTNLNLYKTDMDTDGDDLFDFDRDLNDNNDKIDARFGVQTITLSANGWTGTASPYSQTLNVEGITSAMNPHIALKPNEDYDTAQNEASEYAKLYKGETGNGTITFYANKQTGIDLELQLKIL